MKTTKWFSCRILPVHKGWYDVRLWDACEFNTPKRYWWNGWSWCEDGIYDAIARTDDIYPGWHQKDQWRGLKEPVNDD